MTTRPALRALLFVVLGLARSLREHRINHLHDELLLGARQLSDAIHLLLELGRGAALIAGLAIVSEKGFDGDAEAHHHVQ